MIFGTPIAGRRAGSRGVLMLVAAAPAALGLSLALGRYPVARPRPRRVRGLPHRRRL